MKVARFGFALAAFAVMLAPLPSPAQDSDQQDKKELKDSDAQKPKSRPFGPAPKTGEHPVSGRQFAPVMGVGGAAWLERGDREELEKPDVVIAAMELKEDDKVADLGCGTGFFTRRIAKKVPKGKVYANDIQQPMLELLGNYLKQDNLTNVVPVLGEVNDPKLPKGEMNWILLVDVYHEFSEPEVMLQKMLESLAPGGKIALVEYRLEGETAAHIKKEHRMSVKQVLAEWNPAGFELVDLNESLPSQRIFIFHKRPDYPKPAAAN